jgi:hypothetical protein
MPKTTNLWKKKTKAYKWRSMRKSRRKMKIFRHKLRPIPPYKKRPIPPYKKRPTHLFRMRPVFLHKSQLLNKPTE